MAAVVLPRPLHTIAGHPALAVPAPTSPPTSACELLEGMPSSQVMTFHTIAPISAPKMTRGSTILGSMIPVPSVSATCNPKNRKAMKLKKAAQATAYCGFSTRVDTMVAMELAASCSPLRKSNSNATPISAISSGRLRRTASIRRFLLPSYVIENDALQLVGNVVEPVDHLFQVIVDLVADDVVHRLRLGARIKIFQTALVHVVGFALKLGDLFGDGADARSMGADGSEQRNSFLHQFGAFHDQI